MQKRLLALILSATALTVGCSAIALAVVGHTVYYHGQVLTQDAQEINGKIYVPLADVARALGGHIAPQGKVGDWFFDGRWQFRVNSVERMDSERANKYEQYGHNKPAGAGDTLIVVNCTIKNGHKEAEEPILATNGLGGQQTAMTDYEGQSYPPVDFDVRGGNLAPARQKPSRSCSRFLKTPGSKI